MLPSRFPIQSASAVRKSRLEGKPSLLPKPKDRLSAEARRPSAAGHRSSSAEAPRATFAGGRLSREASATKLATNKRSRSQQGERFGQSSMTPLRSSQFSRPTTTPTRTPSEDRASRSWMTSLERALAFVTIKDQRPISNIAWQRSEFARVQDALAARGGGVGGGLALVRPLTITRFVEVTGSLLNAIFGNDFKLSNDNYVTKLPHLSKRLLYPGTVSKSWLKTVNTLHAFPQALALVAYLLDLANDIETPVDDDWIYADKDELSRLRRDYLSKCWIRFQEPGHQFEDLNEEYLQNLKALLGTDEGKIEELQEIIKKYEASLEDEVEAAARAEEARLTERRTALLNALRSERAARRAVRADVDKHKARLLDMADEMKALDQDIERLTAESQELKSEVESQSMSVAERNRLLDEVHYANRVVDSKRALAEQVAKMVNNKEAELASWQKMTLDSCLQYKQGLIHLSAQFPSLGQHAIDEKDLMGAQCGAQVAEAVDALRACAGTLAARRADCARRKGALARKRAQLLEEARAGALELQASIQREENAIDAAVSKENAESASWNAAAEEMKAKVAELQAKKAEYARVDAELQFWEKQDVAWRTKLAEIREYAAQQRKESARLLEEARKKRVLFIQKHVNSWNEKLDEFELQ